MSELTAEQKRVLECDAKKMIVSASAGSGKTFVLINYICDLMLKKSVPLRRMLILTFTRAAAGEMRERLGKALLEQNRRDKFVLEQIDDLSIADISTIDAFCEKLIKRNIDKLPLDEDFRLVENPDVLKRQAFDSALSQLEKNAPQMLDEIYYSYRRNKDKIYEIVLKLENFFVFQNESRLQYFIKNQAKLFDDALHFLNEKLKHDRAQLVIELDSAVERFEVEPKYMLQCQALKNIMSFKLEEDFVLNVHNLRMLSLPDTPRVSKGNRDETLCEQIKALRAKCKNFIDGFRQFEFDQKVLFDKQKNGSLCVALLTLYDIYAKEYALAKDKLDVLDFVDIETSAQRLLKNDNILSDLQDKYDYIFVDEYQDTNKVQESIIKPLTAKGHFVAVGDPKQGIYGFRNATMEVMQQDIAQFSQSADGGTLYLNGNFRSDARVLDFVNKIFSKIMTEESVGIDYLSTSMLKSQVNFLKPEFPSVRIDIVDERQKEKSLSAGLYSVKKDGLQTDDKDSVEIDTIIARIDDMLVRKIYDAKLKDYRQVEFDDIAILMRSRHKLMGVLCAKLNQKGYPCYADVRESPADEPEVQMLVNLLKLLLDKNDDIALVSVMCSKLGGFTLDKVATMRLEHPNEKHFYEVYELCLDQEDIAQFDGKLDRLKLLAQVQGLSKALRQFFVENNYFAYLKMMGLNKCLAVNNFLQDIASHEFEFDIAGAISYFEEVGGTQRNNPPSGSGIKILTIHASKGLEYPIVILAGCGKKLGKTNTSGVEINDQFGLCVPVVDQFNNTTCTTPNLEAAKILNKRKEMIDEIMIFYVALTRAKSHLYIVGQASPEKFLDQDFEMGKYKNYLSIILQCFDCRLLDNLLRDESVRMGDWEFNIVSKVEQLVYASEQKTRPVIPNEVKTKVENYLNFVYDGQENCTFSMKNSVTSLNSKSQNHERSLGGQRESVEVGNAYHQALKLIDFSQVVDLQTLNEQLEKNRALFSEGYLDLINRDLLLKNILTIKNIVGEGKLYKEKQFVMSEKICNIMHNGDCDEVLIQGVVDLFALGAQNVLIDYKFSGQADSQILLGRYKTQLDLYASAIEKGFGVRVDKKYILSLKNAEIIEYL